MGVNGAINDRTCGFSFFFFAFLSLPYNGSKSRRVYSLFTRVFWFLFPSLLHYFIYTMAGSLQHSQVNRFVNHDLGFTRHFCY